MKKFDLQAALSGKPVVTRDGQKVLRIVHFPEMAPFPVRVLLEGGRCLEEYTAEGHFYGADEPSSEDLFMASEKKEAWINIYSRSGSDPSEVFGYGYATERQAVHAEDGQNILARVRIEYEV